MELHTYSSLSRNFLEQYKDCMNKADEAVVYFNRHAIELKRLEDLSTELVAEAFGKDGLRVFTDKSEVEEFVKKNAGEQVNILMMSSGNFGGVDLKQLAKEVIG
jgi:UDP-N-acetylmuramate: L-alanyl-gamma-D-glutamyl-meso-diaminopimelate ligase